ncbi:dihydroorotase [Psychrobium sp. MM17-31]|uniref:dihydroorotase n=1 Tax=Psychrobium sp. MM17-31 TaxID=2917758 RepID=UPI001EF5ECED|nr:dihydroorotase [Psychrobium sp. MM17-31]MCG7531519.1 dihydroorotase [Psychrobium sp. MM17-31]
MTTITITRPDDWHLHLRDEEALATTVPDSAKYMGRAIIMPNLVPPVTTAVQALSYRERILANRPATSQFDPLMVMYLTDNISAEEIKKAFESGKVYAAKLYPAGATTNSSSGVTDVKNIYPVLAMMSDLGMPLLVHGEVTDNEIDIFDREAVFISKILKNVVADFPSLKIVMEHITTKQAVDFVMEAQANVGATITAHHLLYNRNHMLVGGIKPHYYCLPILKRNTHQQALIEAAISGSPKFFLGTDSAPHIKDNKEAACGCAGAYTAFAAIELYAEVFEKENALDKLEGFASHHGPDFYGLPRNTDTITLTKQAWTVPDTLPLGNDIVVPLKAGETIGWTVN